MVQEPVTAAAQEQETTSDFRLFQQGVSLAADWGSGAGSSQVADWRHDSWSQVCGAGLSMMSRLYISLAPQLIHRKLVVFMKCRIRTYWIRTGRLQAHEPDPDHLRRRPSCRLKAGVTH